MTVTARLVFSCLLACSCISSIAANQLDYTITWVGNSFSGADDKWVQNVFTGGWEERGKIWVNRMSDGREVGVLEPDESVGGVENTGWIDLLTGISAFRRSDGEYLIFVEENARAKCLIYRWRP